MAWAPLAEAQIEWLTRLHHVNLTEPVTRVLSLGPQPHPYRRIKRTLSGFCLAVKDWRVHFCLVGRNVTVEFIATGYGPGDLATSPDPGVVTHREFVARFGDG